MRRKENVLEALCATEIEERDGVESMKEKIFSLESWAIALLYVRTYEGSFLRQHACLLQRFAKCIVYQVFFSRTLPASEL